MLLGGGWVSSTQSLVTDLRPYAVIGVVSSPSWPWFFFFFLSLCAHCAATSRSEYRQAAEAAPVLDSPHCASKRLPRWSNRYPPLPSSRYPPRPRSTWSAGRGSDGPWTISLTNLTVLPRPLANTMKGPYVPGRRAEALAFTLSVTVTPLVSVTPWVGLAVSQDGVLIE